MTKSIRSTIEDRIEAGIDAAETKVKLAGTAPESMVRNAAEHAAAAIEGLKISLHDLDNSFPKDEDQRQQKIPGADPDEPTDDDFE